MRIISTRLLCFVGVLWLGSASSAGAQVLPYKFVRIADTVTNPEAQIDGLSCVGLNNAGTVVIKSQNVLWRGTGGSLEMVASSAFGVCPSINDSGEIAYMTSIGGTSVLVKNLDGSVVTLASATSPPFLYLPTTYLPSLTSGGTALVTTDSGNSIHIVPSGVAVYDPDIHPPLFFFSSPASMNDSEHAVFGGSDATGEAIYRNGAVVFIRNGQAVTGGTIRLSALQRPLINNAGRIAFAGRLDPPAATGPNGVYTSLDGVNLALATSSVIDRFSLNNAGHVAYRGTLSSPRTGVYLGRPGAIAQKVAPENGSIDGTVLNDAFVWEESLNDLGQIAFWAHLADGREAVYRADPQWLKTLTFSNNIPGCGPVKAKVTLNAPAPPGGLSVSLDSGNPSASVPAAVVVPAGKSTATFNITPTAVTANAVGAIEATVGPQTLERTLTVRPIGIKSVVLTPNPVTGGSAVTGTATLDCGAAPGNIVAILSSSKPTAAQPSAPSLTFTAGTASLPFGVTTSAVAVSTSATIKAKANGLAKSKKLVINP
jgi:hypothetical protein